MTTLPRTFSSRDSRADVAAIQHALAPLAQRRRNVGLLAEMVRWDWVLGGMLLLELLLDAVLRLPAPVRIACALGLMATAIAAIVTCWRIVRRSDNWLREAGRIDQATRPNDNAAVNATLLAQGPGATTPLAHQLRRRALDNGQRAAQTVAPCTIVPGRPVVTQLLWLLAAGTAWLIVTIIEPRLIATGLLRLAHPWGDHPPFSQTTFQIHINPVEPLAGDDTTITATLGGLIPDDATLALFDLSHNITGRWSMQAQSDATFNRVLRDVREPLTFRIEAGDGWSRRMTIIPKPPPPALDVTSPASSEDVEGDASTGATGTASASAGAPQAAEVAASRELLDAAEHLAAQSAALASRLAGLRQDASPVPAWLDEQLSALEQRRGQFARRSQILAPRLGQTASQLELPDTNPMPAPADPKSAQESKAALRQWLEQVGNAAANDADTLMSGLQVLGVQPHEQAAPVPLLAEGVTTEIVRGGDETPTSTDARLEQVPPEYRQLVARYYEALDRPGRWTQDPTANPPQGKRP